MGCASSKPEEESNRQDLLPPSSPPPPPSVFVVNTSTQTNETSHQNISLSQLGDSCASFPMRSEASNISRDINRMRGPITRRTPSQINTGGFENAIISISNEEYLDFEDAYTIFVVEGKEFRVEKLKLTSNSKYFKDLFFGNQTARRVIELKETSLLTFERFLEFIEKYKISNVNFLHICNDSPDHSRIQKFWKETSELLNFFDQYSVCQTFKEKISIEISKNSCQNGCLGCTNAYIFGIVYGLNIERKLSHSNISEWADNYSMHVPATFCISGAGLAKLLHAICKSSEQKPTTSNENSSRNLIENRDYLEFHGSF